MISDRKFLPAVKKPFIFILLPVTALLFVLYGISLRNDKQEFPVNIPCRGSMIVEAQYDHQKAKMVTSLYFSFLDNHKILVSLSGTAYLYNQEGKLINKKTLLRNIYYDHVQESKVTDTYSMTSSQINIDSIDNMDWETSSLLLINSFFLTGHTDTMVLKKYDDNTMLIENNQSSFALCVFSKTF
ncbi:FidL-like protein [Rahnella bruchi]|uniref:FidL-like protein n=1 Tax=Rahnella bruchi TaxID=1510573 RepID=UPI000EA257A7|nr:FidL-like protein [Rahnella bruchi]